MRKERDENNESATFRDRQNLHEFFERQGQLADLGEREQLREN